MSAAELYAGVSARDVSAFLADVDDFTRHPETIAICANCDRPMRVVRGQCQGCGSRQLVYRPKPAVRARVVDDFTLANLSATELATIANAYRHANHEGGFDAERVAEAVERLIESGAHDPAKRRTARFTLIVVVSEE